MPVTLVDCLCWIDAPQVLSDWREGSQGAAFNGCMYWYISA